MAANAVEYSEAPACTIDISALSKTRFLIQGERKFPYRDVAGRVNINLVDASLAALEAEPLPDDEADATLRRRITAWKRAARKALDARPEDEQVTFDELAASHVAAATASGPKQTPTKAGAATPARQAPRLPSRAPAVSHVVGPSLAPTTNAVAASSATPPHPNSGPKTVAMRRRLFRKPRANDEPTFEDVDVFSEVLPLEADMHYLGQIADARARARPKSKKHKPPPSTPSAAPARSSRRLSIDHDDEQAGGGSESASLAGVGGGAGGGSSGGAGSSSSADDDDSSDVYEVEALLDEVAGRGFLIRWAGYGPEHDSWEPEENVAPEMVAAFRYERALARSNRADDYMLGRTRMLWCAPCASHHPADNFSSRQRGAAAACRSCLSHHYKVQAVGHVSMLTGASHETPSRTAEADAAERRALRRSGKRARIDDSDDDDDGSDAGSDAGAGGDSPAPARAVASRSQSKQASPWAPARARQPVARALSNRQAALEVANSRLFGFGSL